MNFFTNLKADILSTLHEALAVQDTQALPIELSLNTDKNETFGDLSCNAALIAAPLLKKKPLLIAHDLQSALVTNTKYKDRIHAVDIAGPGFLNIFLTDAAWREIEADLLLQKQTFFKSTRPAALRYLIEFVSANPTGPLTLGHGRNAIIGDVLARVLSFLGNVVKKEFYINDAGNQILLLGQSLKARCSQEFGNEVALPEEGYAGDYLIELAKECIADYGEAVLEQPDHFFAQYAMERLLDAIKKDLSDYNVSFDSWFSEKKLHQDGSISQAIGLLEEKNLAYVKDEALWFKSAEFGDDKDRVIKKSDGTLTYIAADIAYHKNKFDRGNDIIIDILGQDHHGYVKRLKGTMEALGYNPDNLVALLYQLVTIKKGDEAIRMSKRKGTFTSLREIIDTVGVDVARFFYLNRKAEAHLEFDLEVALKKSEENPVYYIQYAYVRTNSILAKASAESEELATFIAKCTHDGGAQHVTNPAAPERIILKKILSLLTILQTIERNYQIHLLAYYTFELAHTFHTYYGSCRIISLQEKETTKQRLLIVLIVQNTLSLCLDLLGLSKPETM